MSHPNLFYRYKLHHVIFWLVVLFAWYFLRADDYANRSLAFGITLVKVSELALMIYLTNYILIPKLLYRRKYFLFSLIFFVLVFGSSLVKLRILGIMRGDPHMYDITVDFKTRLYDNILPHFFLVIAGAAVKLLFDFSKLQRRIAQIAKEKAETELNFLKSQINPHFLFNSINSVYFLIDKQNHEAREALHKFSDMLRYQLYEMNGEKIPVEKEIRYLQDYVGLQKLRKDEHYSVEFHCDPGVNGFSIEPLLLVPLVENAFKHISHYKDRPNTIKLDLNRQNGEFHFNIENTKESQVKNTEVAGGIGLSNVRRRLELLYPEKHKLNIDDEGDKFRVELSIEV